MAKMFENINVGDQLELSVSRGCVVYGAGADYDPDAVYRVAIVTHIWFDPVEAKEYVGIAYLRNDGSYGKPTEKRTLTGLARTGWRLAGKDWLAFLNARRAAEADGKIINLQGRRA